MPPGFMIRFIDLGLLVLFGFVMISDIDSSTPVDIAAAASVADSAPARHETFVTVGITAAGAFEVTAPGAAAPIGPLMESGDLERVLRQIKQDHGTGGRGIIVLIRPDEASVLQRTVDVMDVCDRLALKKSLQMLLGPVAPR